MDNTKLALTLTDPEQQRALFGALRCYIEDRPEKLGELVVAWVRLRDGEAATSQEIRDFCEGKIAYFKIPQHIRFVESFPMTATGKIQKFKMREIEARQVE